MSTSKGASAHSDSNASAYAGDGVGTRTLELLEEARDYNRWIVDAIRPYLGDTNLELGAGRGTLSQIVAETHPLIPFEIADANRAFLNERFAGNARVAPCQADLLAYREWRSVDCVYSANVLEHIPDDLAILRHSAELLKPGGYFVAFVPAGMWLYSKFDRSIGHFRRYGLADRDRLSPVQAEQARLNLVDFRFMNLPGAFGWFLKMRLLGQTQVRPNDIRLVSSLLPIIRSIDRLRLPIGQSALLVWQRQL